MKRMILTKIPAGMHAIQGVTYDGVLDVLTDAPAPVDALYVAEQAEDGTVTVQKDVTEGRLLTKHTFAGWPLSADAARDEPKG